MFQKILSLGIFKNLFLAAWQSHSSWITYFSTIFFFFFKHHLKLIYPGVTWALGGKSHIRFISYLQMKLPGFASHFPLVEKCLCYSIFAFYYTNLRNSQECSLKSSATLLSSTCFLGGKKKKVPKPFPGPRLGGEIPLEMKRQNRTVQRSARWLMALVTASSWRWRDAGCGRGHGTPAGTLASGPDLPAPYRLSIERRNEPASKGCSFDVSADTSHYHCPSQK